MPSYVLHVHDLERDLACWSRARATRARCSREIIMVARASKLTLLTELADGRERSEYFCNALRISGMLCSEDATDSDVAAAAAVATADFWTTHSRPH